MCLTIGCSSLIEKTALLMNVELQGGGRSGGGGGPFDFIVSKTLETQFFGFGLQLNNISMTLP